MAIKTKLYYSESTNPWFNLAYEEQLVNEVAEDEVYLYLWQNQHTVVIGKHQNPWREVLVNALEQDGGKLARRLSGGGAVYHDLGNLNFTFVMHKKHEDLHRQLKVIVEGVKTLGIDAAFSGRNDILADERKFSGNAFYFGKENYYHHGTILVDVDMSKLGKFLNVSMKKLNAKGVESVKSRVVNLKELNSELTIEAVKKAISTAFESEYGKAEMCHYISEETTSLSAKARFSHYASWEWLYGKTPNFDVTFEEKFDWGELVVSFKLKGAVIEETGLFSDAMNTDLVELLKHRFNGKRLEIKSLVQTLEETQVSNELKPQIEEISAWFKTLAI